MTSKLFTYKILLTLFIVIIGFVTINVSINSFRLFFNPKDNKNMVVDDRTTKYLFTYNYIPKKINSVLIGPSLSDIEMDTKKITSDRIYNLSLNSENITELKILIDKLQKNTYCKKL